MDSRAYFVQKTVCEPNSSGIKRCTTRQIGDFHLRIQYDTEQNTDTYTETYTASN